MSYPAPASDGDSEVKGGQDLALVTARDGVDALSLIKAGNVVVPATQEGLDAFVA